MSQTFWQHCGSLGIKGAGHTHSICCGSSECVSRSCQAIKAFTLRHEPQNCTMTLGLCSLMEVAANRSTPTDVKLCLERALSKGDHPNECSSIVKALPRP